MEEIKLKLREFAEKRNWEQFHTPKNLVMALSGEVGELIDIFQWLTPEESQKIKRIITFGISAIAITATSMVLLKLASIMVQDIKKMQG